MKYNLGQTVSALYDLLAQRITHHIRHDCLRYNLPCSECEQGGQSKALAALESISGHPRAVGDGCAGNVRRGPGGEKP